MEQQRRSIHREMLFAGTVKGKACNFYLCFVEFHNWEVKDEHVNLPVLTGNQVNVITQSDV